MTFMQSMKITTETFGLAQMVLEHIAMTEKTLL